MLGAESVDILCIGSGSAGLAAGVAGADAGLKVYVAEPSRGAAVSARPLAGSVESWATVLQKRWGADEFNTSTAAYLEQLTSGLGPPAPTRATGQIAIGTVETFAGVRIDPSAEVPPFYGADLAGWARECLTSPFGMIFSRVSGSNLTEVRRIDGKAISAGLIAPVPTTRRREVTVRQWLTELAQQKGVALHESCSVQRLLFNDGRVVGAVLDAPDGVRSVRARRGVVLGTSCSAVDDSVVIVPPTFGGDTALCVVGRTASRFARLEFLLSAASSRAYPASGRLA